MRVGAISRYHSKRLINRFVVADPKKLQFVPVSDGFYLMGSEAGQTTAFVFNDFDDVGAFQINVLQTEPFSESIEKAEEASFKSHLGVDATNPPNFVEPSGRYGASVEYWQGGRKDVLQRR